MTIFRSLILEHTQNINGYPGIVFLWIRGKMIQAEPSVEDEKTYSQRLVLQKERQFVERKTETSDHRQNRLAKRRFKENLKSITIQKEHSQVVSRTRGALKRKALNDQELCHPSKKLKEVIRFYRSL